MPKFQEIVQSVTLRRTKKDLIDGKPIKMLPENTENIDYVVLGDDELAVYSQVESTTKKMYH